MKEVLKIHQAMVRKEAKKADAEERKARPIPMISAYEEWVFRLYKRKGITEAQKRMEKDAAKATARPGYMPLAITKSNGYFKI